MLTACCSGAECRDKMLDEVSTAIHGGATAVKVKERVYFTPKNTNKPSLIPVCYSVFRV